MLSNYPPDRRTQPFLNPLHKTSTGLSESEKSIANVRETSQLEELSNIPTSVVWFQITTGILHPDPQNWQFLHVVPGR